MPPFPGDVVIRVEALELGYEDRLVLAGLNFQVDRGEFLGILGPNGSGKSNLLEVLAAIFFQLEILRVRRSFLPDNFLYDERDNPKGFRDGDGIPDGFELDYQIRVPANFCSSSSPEFAAVKIIKVCGKSPEISWLNQAEFAYDKLGVISDRERDFLLPEYVLGYSSGENEILSLPFFKMRFVQFDEYWHALKE
ncbi:MAG: ATP-binding cassette domain-containing protein, partial [Proteobacteria bacterium]|nr:ATP-binding cassette domain-containing protein [Pseudomonadota bacterium]